MHRLLAIAPALWLAAATGQEAAPAPGPDLDFLEYLGSWDEGEDEWLDIEEWRHDDGADAGRERDREPSERERERDDDDERE